MQSVPDANSDHVREMKYFDPNQKNLPFSRRDSEAGAFFLVPGDKQTE